MVPTVLWLLPRRNRRFILAVFFAYLVPALLLQVADHARSVGSELRVLGLPPRGGVVEVDLYAGAILFLFLFLYAAVERIWRRHSSRPSRSLTSCSSRSSSQELLDLPLRWRGSSRREIGSVTYLYEADLTVAVLGALLAMVPGTILVAAYLVVTDLISRKGLAFGRHTTELFAAQQRTGYKNFLRIHISGESGAMTIYPICVPRAGKFEFRTGGTGNEPFFKPTKPIEWGLIEQPIVVGGDPPELETLFRQEVMRGGFGGMSLVVGVRCSF